MTSNAGPQPYADAQTFVTQFLANHPDLSAGEASRQAYAAAHRIGLPALYVEAKVYDQRKREAKEIARQRNEWTLDYQAAGR